MLKIHFIISTDDGESIYNTMRLAKADRANSFRNIQLSAKHRICMDQERHETARRYGEPTPTRAKKDLTKSKSRLDPFI